MLLPRKGTTMSPPARPKMGQQGANSRARYPKPNPPPLFFGACLVLWCISQQNALDCSRSKMMSISPNACLSCLPLSFPLPLPLSREFPLFFSPTLPLLALLSYAAPTTFCLSLARSANFAASLAYQAISLSRYDVSVGRAISLPIPV